jgi:F0F1-type ATP synthase assembly protein I
MKLLNTNVRINARDSFGQGLDATITLLVFLAAGFGLDRWLGTTPLFMIVLTVIASIGIFYKLKLGYDAKMTQHEQRLQATREATGSAGQPAEHPAGQEVRP